VTLEFRYEFEDTLTREKIDVLPLYGVHFNSFLVTRGNNSRYGDCTATVSADVLDRSPSDVVAATEPERTNLWVYQGDQPVWGGIIWSRTYSSQAGGTFQLYAQSFDSYAMGYVFDTDETFTGDPRNISREIWDHIQNAGPEWNIGLKIPSAYSGASSFTKTILADEQVIAGDVITEMVNMGAEYRLVYTVESGRPRANIEWGRWDGLASKLGIPASSGSPLIDYPGTIAHYWLTDSGSKGGTDFFGIGKGTGPTTPRGYLRDQSAIDSGRPAYARKLNFREAETQTLLDGQLVAAREVYKLPVVSPSVKLRSLSRREGPGLQFDGTQNVFGTFNMGDYLYTVINDPKRFDPSPLKTYYRAVSVGVSPGADEFDVGLGQETSYAE
jgi:hypothetical protein